MRRTDDCTQTPSFNEVFAQGADPGGSEGGALGAQTQLLVGISLGIAAEALGVPARVPRTVLGHLKVIRAVRRIGKP
jgi:hypothetical protein